MKLFINSAISLLSEIGIYLCVLIAIWMASPELGMTVLGLYVIRWIAEVMIRREQDKKIQELFENAERLDE